jgi:hypothetical protein
VSVDSCTCTRQNVLAHAQRMMILNRHGCPPALPHTSTVQAAASVEEHAGCGVGDQKLAMVGFRCGVAVVEGWRGREWRVEHRLRAWQRCLLFRLIFRYASSLTALSGRVTLRVTADASAQPPSRAAPHTAHAPAPTNPTAPPRSLRHHTAYCSRAQRCACVSRLTSSARFGASTPWRQPSTWGSCCGGSC